MLGFQNTAVLGAGVIGMSWAALFLASGRNVAVFDTVASAEKTTRDYVEMAWPALRDLGLIKGGAPGRLTFHKSAAEAVRVADFVQESVPEQIEVKEALFAEIEPALKSSAIVASSASGLTLSEMQAGWKKPSRFVLGHPFNPPHLIPLVEVLANDLTEDGVADKAEQFYRDAGKITIRVRREVPGHVANRLQAALWREALHLVKSPSRMWIRRCGRGPDCGGRRWDQRCCSTSAPGPVGSRRSASAIPPASIAGGMTSALFIWTRFSPSNFQMALPRTSAMKRRPICQPREMRLSSPCKRRSRTCNDHRSRALSNAMVCYWQILLQKSHGDASDETMESELRMQRIEVALLQPSAIQSCAPRPPKYFCNNIGLNSDI